MAKVLIIDPIFRGSRLFYTQLAARTGSEIVILTRTDAQTEESEVALAGINYRLKEVVTTAKDSWYYHLNPRQLLELKQALHETLAKFKPDLLFMAGLDELKPAFGDILASCSHRLVDSAVLGVHYTPAVTTRLQIFGRTLPIDFGKVKPAHAFGQQSRKFKKLLGQVPNLRSALLDERIYDQLRDDPLFLLMPDPPPPIPDPSDQSLIEARKDRGALTFLLVGRQSSRKGLGDILDLLERHPTSLPKGSKFVLCGKLEKEVEHLRPVIEGHSQQITHVDRYLSDEEIRARYLESDYVLLPYTTGFTGSSGVLASAASAGKPVIATNHGLIGYRVERHGMGLTYPSTDIDALAGLMADLPNPESDRYQSLSTACGEFSRKNSVEAFTSILREAMAGR